MFKSFPYNILNSFFSQIGDHRPQYAFLNQNGHQQQHNRGSSFQPPQFRPPPTPSSTTTAATTGETVAK